MGCVENKAMAKVSQVISVWLSVLADRVCRVGSLDRSVTAYVYESAYTSNPFMQHEDYQS
jgi:hypothetical protein